jgi:hypothetical protein
MTVGGDSVSPVTAHIPSWPCHQREDYNKRWTQAFRARRAGDIERAKKIVAQQTKGYAVLLDVPHISFVPELVELYPEAKFVLVERNPESWWKSFSKVMDMCYNPVLPFMTWPAPNFDWFPAHLREWRRHAELQLDHAGLKMGPGK